MNVLQGLQRDDTSTARAGQGSQPRSSDAGPSALEANAGFLTWNRLDLAFKLHYLESAADGGTGFSEQLYDDHLRALTEAADPMRAAYNETPQSRSRLDETYRALREGRDAATASSVRLAADGSVLTGIHEAACALALGKPLAAMPTDQTSLTYDYRFFERRGVGREHLDAAVMRFIEGAPDSFVALIWPAAEGSDEEIGSILGPLVYRKPVALDLNGAHNLLSQVYEGEAWLGDPAQNYPGIRNKLVPCFARSGPLRVFVFQRPDLDSVLAAKQAVRDRMALGKHSIHITDSHQEAVRIARLLLNDRGVHFLNSAHPTRFASTLRMVRGFEEYLRRKAVPAERAIVDSGMVLAAFGLREAQDVDFMSPVEVEDEAVFSRHGPEPHGLSLGDLLHDPRNHFHYWGLRFVSLEQVARMKRRRKVGRDIDDLGLIGPVLAGKSGHPSLAAMMHRARFAAAKARRRAIGLARQLGVYDALKRTQRSLRRRS